MGWKFIKDGIDEVLVVFGEKVGWKNGVGGGIFVFVGVGWIGMCGVYWQNVVVFLFIKVIYDKFVEGIMNLVVLVVFQKFIL